MEDNSREIIEEKEINQKGEISFRKYYKKNILEAVKIKYYEIIDCKTNKKNTGKIISKKDLVKTELKQKLINEIKLEKSCNHPSIESLLHYENVYILYEYCKNGTLENLIFKRKKLTELEVQYYLIQLIKALKYMHKNKILHRNLKLSNILLTEKMEIKITGFNHSVKLKSKEERRKAICGTPNYVAPED